MKRRVTLVTMAHTLGLSRSTVSEILNGSSNYAEETILRVKKLAEKLHYQPDRFAQATRRGRSNLIGILHAGGMLQVVNERAFYLGAAISRTGYESLVGDWLWHIKTSMLSLVRLMLASRVEGIIFSDAATFFHSDTKAILDLVNSANIPAVIISAPHQPNIPAINADFEGGFYALTQHLLSTGRQRLTLQLGEQPQHSWHTILRYRGFCRAIREAGGVIHDLLPVRHYRKRWKRKGIQGEILLGEPLVDFPSDPFLFPHNTARQTYEELLDNGFTTEGIVATNDQWAASIINASLRRGWQIPEAFAVTGFDNSFLSQIGPVPFTTASQETEQTCQRAVDLLLERMRGNRERASSILIPCPILIRESTAPPGRSSS